MTTKPFPLLQKIFTHSTQDDPQRYKTITFDDAIQKNLKVMDATAFTLCRDQKLPIGVIDIFKENALKNILIGSEEGTLVNI